MSENATDEVRLSRETLELWLLTRKHPGNQGAQDALTEGLQADLDRARKDGSGKGATGWRRREPNPLADCVEDDRLDRDAQQHWPSNPPTATGEECERAQRAERELAAWKQNSYIWQGEAEGAVARMAAETGAMAEQIGKLIEERDELRAKLDSATTIR